jgi:uncharacterized membrane protein
MRAMPKPVNAARRVRDVLKGAHLLVTNVGVQGDEVFVALPLGADTGVYLATLEAIGWETQIHVRGFRMKAITIRPDVPAATREP